MRHPTRRRDDQTTAQRERRARLLAAGLGVWTALLLGLALYRAAQGIPLTPQEQAAAPWFFGLLLLSAASPLALAWGADWPVVRTLLTVSRERAVAAILGALAAAWWLAALVFPLDEEGQQLLAVWTVAAALTLIWRPRIRR